MLTRITGTLETLDGTTAVVSLSPAPGGPGVAHEALVSPAHSASLGALVGTRVTLHTLELLESHNQGASFTPRLLGFASREDRAFFELLTRVKGLGPRRALRALALPTAEIARAIAEGDARRLSTLPEIGKKLAETIIAELREKVSPFLGAAGAGEGGDAPLGAGAVMESRLAFTGASAQAVAALVRLGESRAEAERLVDHAIRSNGADTARAPADAILAAALGARGV